jgi:hypothetical protein
MGSFCQWSGIKTLFKTALCAGFHILAFCPPVISYFHQYLNPLKNGRQNDDNNEYAGMSGTKKTHLGAA